MKKLILATALTVLTAPVFAATPVCTGLDAADATVSDNDMFIQNQFTQKCSANVFLQYAEDSTNAAVGSASKKGKNVFAGSTAGGAVAPTGTTSTNGFADGSEAGTAADTALTNASSS